MGSVFPRGAKLWIKYKDATGAWVPAPTGLDVGQEKAARALLAKIEATVSKGEPVDLGPTTVASYATKWLKERKQRGIASAVDDESRFNCHIAPRFGASRLEDVRPHQVRDFVRAMKADGKLAARTIRNVYAVLHRLFADALVDEVIATNPCVLKRHDLPKLVDKDPSFRRNAVFTRNEVELIVSDKRVPFDRRALYAIMFLGGLRFGEAAALRWRDYEVDAEPLGRLNVAASYSTRLKREKTTKTERSRRVPVHPALAKLLAEWKLSGWHAQFGRHATADDLIVPSRIGSGKTTNATEHLFGKNRNASTGKAAFDGDLERLDLRGRRQHDARRTFISLCLDDGARRDRLEWVTHGRRGDIVGMYDEPQWAALCEEVAKLKIAMRDDNVIELPKAAFGTALGTVSATAESTPSKHQQLQASLTREKRGANGIRTRA